MSQATMTAADKFGIAFSIGFTVALIAIAMSFSTMSQSPAPVVTTPPPAPAPAPAPAPTPAPAPAPIEEPAMEEETMEEEMVMEEEAPVMEEKEAAPLSAEVSIPNGSSLPGCEETNECYIPYVVTVSVGGTVTWTNDDTAAHTVTSGTLQDSESVGAIFDSSIFMAGKTFAYTFDEAGTYDYFCIVHPWMTGQVAVE